MPPDDRPDRALTRDPRVRGAVLARRLRSTERVRRRLERRHPGGVAARALAAEEERIRRALGTPPEPRAAPAPARSADEAPARIQGLRFDMARNVWVTADIDRDRSWWFHLRLCQLLDWEIEGVVQAREELVERLCAAASEPGTGTPLVPRGEVAALVEDLHLAARAPDGEAQELLDLAVDLQFTSTDGGDTPVAVTWQLSPRLVGTLLAVLDDEALRDRLAGSARAQASREQAELSGRRTALEEVLARCPGRPAWHSRAHWALVNLASAGQSVGEMARPGGLLPRDRAELTPELLAKRFGDAGESKLRFVLNDRLRIHVLDDEDYRHVMATHGFPPNHEFLSGVRPIMAAGYLTVDRGRVVGIEDDGLMIPGKLPPGLPPIAEVLEALGFPLDAARVAASTRVLDWAGFAAACEQGGGSGLPGEVATLRERLDGLPYGEREPAAVAGLRRLLARTARAHPEAERSALRYLAARDAAEALRGYRLINVGGRDVASGDLPAGAEWIDEELAPYLLRKAQG